MVALTALVLLDIVVLLALLSRVPQEAARAAAAAAQTRGRTVRLWRLLRAFLVAPLVAGIALAIYLGIVHSDLLTRIAHAALLLGLWGAATLFGLLVAMSQHVWGKLSATAVVGAVCALAPIAYLTPIDHFRAAIDAPWRSVVLALGLILVAGCYVAALRLLRVVHPGLSRTAAQG